MRIIGNELYREVGGDKACNQQQKEIANNVNSKLSSLSKKPVYPTRTGLFEIQFAINPRLDRTLILKENALIH